MTPTHQIQWRYDHWVKHPETLDPYERHIYVEVYETGTGVTFSKEELRQEDIPSLCERSTSSPETKWALRLLITPRRSYTDPAIGIPYSLDSIDALQSYWHIPSNYVPTYHSAHSGTISFSPILTDSAWKGLILVLAGAGFCHLVTTYNIETKQIFVVCAAVSKTNTDRLIRRLENLQGCELHPCLVPVILTSCAVDQIRDDITTSEHEYLAISKVLGCARTYTYDLSYGEAAAPTERPQRLTELVGTVARDEYSMSSMLYTLGHLENVIRSLPTIYPSSLGLELQERVMFMRHGMANMKNWNQYIRDGAQSLVQMVYAVSQQDDNKITQRYGADMRLITAITLVFLPGTFVATFFSSSFWDFAPGNNGSKVSKWVWVYWVVTIALTLMVLLVWRYFTVLNQLVRVVTQRWHDNSVLRRRRREEELDDEEAGKKGA